MTTSFYNGISGITTHQFGIDTWANNIANVNNFGYKENIPEFSTIFSTQLSENYLDPTSNDKGLGARATSSAIDMKQGSFVNSDNNFDLAISGNGWFGVLSNDTNTYYTRAGEFSIDAEGNLVDPNGNFLLGTLGDNINGETITPIEEIALSAPESQTKITLPPNLIYPAEPTQNIYYQANLDPIVQYDANGNEIANYETFSTSLIAPNGETHTLKIEFTKQIPQAPTGSIWDVVTTIYDTNDTIVDTQTGVLTFDDNGALIGNTLGMLSNSGTPLNLDLGTPYDATVSNSGYDGFTSLVGAKKDTSVTKDGYKAGDLTNYEMDSNGQVVAIFDNGRSVPIAKVALYHFQNDQGLEKLGSNLFKYSQNSGKPIFYTDSDGKYIYGANIFSKKLEQSNVSLATALTELIVIQKAFDASAKSITTSDQMIQKAINMKK